ncbi:MAG: chromate efflux transporter [Acidobacteriota bacterium]
MVTRKSLALTFFLIGLTSYGGPAIVAQIRQVVVLKRRWLTEEEFQESLAFCQTIPGPIAVQTAAHIGWRMYGGLGEAIALTAYVFPAFGLMLALSAAYFRFGSVPLVAAVFKGLGAVVVGIVAESILSMTQSALRDWKGLLIASAAAAAFFTRQSTLLVLFGSAAIGALWIGGPPWRWRAGQTEGVAATGNRTPWRETVAWASGVGLLFAALVAASGFLQPLFPALGLVMVKVNLLAFGGGYTAVALMYEQVVASHAWLTAKEFIDGLALGQITPGPVIVTATFIGYKVGGVGGSCFATLCVFLPSSLLMAVLAPQFQRIRRYAVVGAAVRGLLAAFIAMLFLVLWQVGKASLLDWPTVVMALAALTALRLKVNPVWVILAALGVAAVFFR